MKKMNKLILIALMSVIGMSTASAQCNASFTSTDNSGGNFSFTNTSTSPGANLYSVWDFGDGSSVWGQNPNHSYTYSGTYSVCLTINDTAFGGTCTSTYCDSVIVTGTGTPCNYTIISYDSLGSTFFEPLGSNGSSNGSTYFWDFGDGTTATSSVSSGYSHQYLAAGTYYYCVTIDSCPPICDSIVVSYSTPCNVTAGFTYTDNGGGNFSFTNTSIATAFDSQWSFDDGNTSYIDNPSNTYLVDGTYQICLTIVDSGNIFGVVCTSTYCDSIVVTGLGSGIPCNITAGYTYTDNGSGSISFSSIVTGGVAPYTYNWWFDGTGSTVANPTHNYINGQHNATLTVTDVNGCIAWFDDTVTVTSATPCNISAGISYTDNGNGNYSFNSTSTGSVNYDVWNYGDGSSDVGGNVNHTFAANGTYVVSLYVSDSLAGMACDDYAYVTIVVTGVSNPAPCQAGYSVYLDSMTNVVNVVNSSTGSNLTYFWEFGDGNYSTLQYPNYTYISAGPFLLCLTVTDSLTGGICSSTYCDSIGSNGYVFKGAAGFTINVIDPTTVGVEEVKQVTSFNVFPNPVKNNVNIEFNLVKRSNVEVFVTDLLGNKVALIVSEEMNAGNNKISYNVSDISSGIYLLSINTDNSIQVKKIVVSK